MARLTVELPEEIRTGGADDVGRADDAELHIGRRSDGGREEPVIVRWFATWAEGAPDLG
jgi:hypothetical protein